MSESTEIECVVVLGLILDENGDMKEPLKIRLRKTHSFISIHSSSLFCFPSPLNLLSQCPPRISFPYVEVIFLNLNLNLNLNIPSNGAGPFWGIPSPEAAL